ncbi:MAG TPA: MFS transporter [Kofleriaceae bacterium]|nr:MFS transporter [Kofleriaceae bacterium]
MLSRRRAWLVAIAATLTMTVSYFDRQTLSVLSIAVMDALHLSKQQYGWLGSAFSAAYLIGTPLAGWWIDRVGSRRGLLVSVFVWSAVAALHAAALGFVTLFMLRLALGIAEGPSFPGAARTVQRILPPGDRERGFGVLFTGSSIGALLAPLFATWVYREAGWRTAFVASTAAAGVLWIPLWYFVTRARRVRDQLDIAPAAPEGPPPRPRLDQLVRHPIILRALAAIFCAAPVFAFPTFWGASFLNVNFGIPQGGVGHFLWLPPLVFDVSAITFGHLAARQHRAEGVPARGLVGAGVALCACLALLPLATTAWQATIGMSLAMAGSAAVYTLVTADLLARMPAHITSFASGILAGAQSMALIIVNPLAGLLVDRLGSYDVPSIALGLWAIPGGIVWLATRPAVRYLPPARVHSDG